MAPSIGKVLVLGGGGVTGVAWEIGVLAGLARAGLSLADADVVIGTSAGSVVAVHVTSGTDPQLSLARQVEGRGQEIAARLGLWTLLRYVWAAVRSRSPTELSVRIGRVALRASTVSEAARREVIASRLPVQAWPERSLRITAVDALSGEPRILTRDDGVPLVDVVAASCAVPGVWPTVTIQGRRYMDGGIRSVANADLAAGGARVVVLAPMPRGLSRASAVQPQADALRRGGSQVVVVSPNLAARRAIGRNSLDPARRAPAARAGEAQAADELAAVRAVWNGLD